MTLLLWLFFCPIAPAAALFTGAGSYPVKPEWKEAAPSFSTLKDARYEFAMTYASFDAGSDKPSFSNETTQRVRWKTLPPEKGEDRFEMLYEDYRMRSKVQLFAGMNPMDTAQDFGVYLSSRPLKLSGSGGQPKKIDNLDTVRTQLAAEVKDPAARQALMVTFQESILLDGTRSFLQENGCLQALAKKKIGAKWKAQLETQGMSVGFECAFEGWAEAGGQRILVVGISVAKSRQETKLPMGAKATVETEGAGKLYFDPKSRESLLKMEMNITQVGQGKGASKLKSSAHALAL